MRRYKSGYYSLAAAVPNMVDERSNPVFGSWTVASLGRENFHCPWGKLLGYLFKSSNFS